MRSIHVLYCPCQYCDIQFCIEYLTTCFSIYTQLLLLSTIPPIVFIPSQSQTYVPLYLLSTLILAIKLCSKIQYYITFTLLATCSHCIIMIMLNFIICQFQYCQILVSLSGTRCEDSISRFFCLICCYQTHHLAFYITSHSIVVLLF